MRPSRVFRLIFRIFVSLLAVSVTIVSILGGLSAVIILTNPNNIAIDPGDINFDFNPSPLNVNFSLPFNITNAGYFDLENLEMTIDLYLNYDHVNYTVPGVNVTRTVQIFNKTQYYNTIPKSQTGYFNFTGHFDDFTKPNIPDFTTEVDRFRGDPYMIIYANFTLSLDYSLGLHSLTIGLLNLTVYEVP
ncbi:MAG: hypothetical protein ACFE9Z_11860 [Promethearchaeota archaeon]